MSLKRWNELSVLGKAIEDEFKNVPNPAQSCPSCPRMHVVYAHFSALPDVDEVLKKLWRFVTLDAYKNRYDRESPARYPKPATDYFAAHFIQLFTKDVKLEKLPEPNLTEQPKPTDVDGGTLVKWKNTTFQQEKITTQITAPAKIPDWKMVEGYGVFPGVAAAATTPAAPAGGATPAAPAGGATPAAPAGGATPAATTAAPVEDGAGYPKRRRLCLCVPGSQGDHKDVDVSGDTVTETLEYMQPTNDREARLVTIAPAFKFVLRPPPPPAPRRAAPRRQRAPARGAPAPAAAPAPPPPPPPPDTDIGQTDPWTAVTFNPTFGTSGKVYETTSNVLVGTFSRYRYNGHEWHGIAKSASTPGVTTTVELAARYLANLGASRAVVFQALRDVEGACESVATYDGPKISWGINQWIGRPGGELFQILSFIYDLFPDAWARRFGYYGLGMYFSGRTTPFNARSAYSDAILYRVPCCGDKVGGALRAVWQAPDPPAAPRRGHTAPAAQTDCSPPALRPTAVALRLEGLETTSLAFAYVLTTAGADPEIQKAMAQWMSYRITSTSPVGVTHEVAIDKFLRSLGSNVDPATRMASARAGLAGAGDVNTLLAGTFSDAGATEEWINWDTRCANAGKSLVRR
jgi:hypothetical protein